MANPRLESDGETVRLSLSIGPKLVTAVDAARGKTPRSAYLRQALELKLAADKPGSEQGGSS